MLGVIAPNPRDTSRAVRAVIMTQLDELIVRLGLAVEPTRHLFHILTDGPLSGPFHDGLRRFSAINRDGVPFQWSLSLGARSPQLRFVTDCGVAGTSIRERMHYGRKALESIADWLSLDGALRTYDRMVAHLLPLGTQVDRSLMGLCIAASLVRDGTPRLKVYVNGELGGPSERRARVAACLAELGRHDALRRLEALTRATGERLAPAFIAFDLDGDRVGRFKLYLRPRDGTRALLARAADVAGCVRATAMLAVLHETFLDGSAYPDGAVDISLEFDADDGEPGFKIDLRTITFLKSDADVNARISCLLSRIGTDEGDYCAVRDVIVGAPAGHEVRQIVFVGLAARRGELQANLYFHPCPLARQS
jgi:hypothetical protein